MVKIYSLKTCPFCIELKEGLDKEGIQYEDRDIGTPKYEKEFNRISEVSKNEVIPLMIIGKQMFVPDVSFNSIEEAIDLAKKFTQV